MMMRIILTILILTLLAGGMEATSGQSREVEQDALNMFNTLAQMLTQGIGWMDGRLRPLINTDDSLLSPPCNLALKHWLAALKKQEFWAIQSKLFLVI